MAFLVLSWVVVSAALVGELYSSSLWSSSLPTSERPFSLEAPAFPVQLQPQEDRQQSGTVSAYIQRSKW